MIATASKTPMRQCVGCGERDEQSRLHRFVLRNGVAEWDRTRTAWGRGAYLHPRSSCLGPFERRKPFLRSLRASVGREDRQRLVRSIEAGS